MSSSSISLNFDYDMHGTSRMHKPPGDLNEATNQLIKDKDQDGNGTLSALEICISDEAFKQADANGDSQLDASELKNNAQAIGKELAAQDPQGPPPPPPPSYDNSSDGSDSTTASTLDELFQQADTNNDGVLSADEFQAAVDEMTKKLETQQQQGASADLDAATRRLVQNLDTNGDGTLSRDELGISQEVFDKADTNGDGQLSTDELKAGAQSIAKELAAQEAAREAALRQYSLLDYIEQSSNAAETGLNVTT